MRTYYLFTVEVWISLVRYSVLGVLCGLLYHFSFKFLCKRVKRRIWELISFVLLFAQFFGFLFSLWKRTKIFWANIVCPIWLSPVWVEIYPIAENLDGRIGPLTGEYFLAFQSHTGMQCSSTFDVSVLVIVSMIIWLSGVIAGILLLFWRNRKRNVASCEEIDVCRGENDNRLFRVVLRASCIIRCFFWMNAFLYCVPEGAIERDYNHKAIAVLLMTLFGLFAIWLVSFGTRALIQLGAIMIL
ncbi:MAG: hypothetical protein HUJ69_04725 [Lachnospiraceae bacterium]|nr:hypothetical protein [Lachnospiraceae bacterium]